RGRLPVQRGSFQRGGVDLRPPAAAARRRGEGELSMDYGLKGQAAIVTGSTSGIGQAMAAALAEQGVDVIVNGLGDPAQIEHDRRALEARTGVNVVYHGADMTRPDEIADLVDAARREFGRLDILVNNAGIQHVAPVDEFPPE